jgi:polyphosphate glucokinase
VTLAIDIGGTGLKASALDPAGQMLADRVRVETTYPMPPTALVDALVALVKPLPTSQRASVGFPGVVRHGRILSAPHFVTTKGPGSEIDPGLVTAWSGFDLGGALQRRLRKPVRVINDADIQGLDAITGSGVELVVTLGTGIGTAVFVDGRLGPRLELSHHPLRHGRTYNEEVGDAARKKVGKATWNRRVVRTIGVLDALLFPDVIYLGGGNARHVEAELPAKVTRIDPNAGILGGLKLWNLAEVG